MTKTLATTPAKSQDLLKLPELVSVVAEILHLRSLIALEKTAGDLCLVADPDESDYSYRDNGKHSIQGPIRVSLSAWLASEVAVREAKLRDVGIDPAITDAELSTTLSLLTSLSTPKR